MTTAAGIAWSPWRHLREWYPDVKVYEAELPGDVLGAVDHDQRIIWLRVGLTHAEKRSTLAYQLGHLELGPFDRDQGDGCMVDDWASRLLIPLDDLLRGFRRLQEPSEVAEELWVDVTMLRARLRGLTEAEKDRLDSICWRWRDAL